MKEIELTKERDFITLIERLDAGKLSKLRRACGESDAVKGRCPWFYEIFGGLKDEYPSFLVAGLLAQYSTRIIKSGLHSMEGNFGVTWRRALADSNSESLKRRLNIILDAYYDPYTGEGDLSYRLRQMVRYSAHKAVGIDWPQLLFDLKRWNHPEKYAQKSWARSFYED